MKDQEINAFRKNAIIDRVEKYIINTWKFSDNDLLFIHIVLDGQFLKAKRAVIMRGSERVFKVKFDDIIPLISLKTKKLLEYNEQNEMVICFDHSRNIEIKNMNDNSYFDYLKGCCFYKKSGSSIKEIIMLVGSFEDKLIFMHGFTTDTSNLKEKSCFLGRRYTNKNIDLMNSSSWGLISYNGVKYDTYCMTEKVLLSDFLFLEKWYVPKFFPLKPPSTIDTLMELDKIQLEGRNFFPDQYLETKWGYDIGTFNLYENFTDSKDLSYS